MPTPDPKHCMPQGAYPLTLDHMAHHALRSVLRPDDWVIDATTGNGYDTLFLAQCLGPRGQLWAFDIQQAALQAAQARLAAAAQTGQNLPHMRYIHDGHENVAAYLAADEPTDNRASPHAELGAVVFNLGYLPRADKHITTTATTTLAALRACMPRLRSGGLISLHVYTGHACGAEEHAALATFTADLPYNQWSVLHTQTGNKHLRTEHLYLLVRHI